MLSPRLVVIIKVSSFQAVFFVNYWFQNLLDLRKKHWKKKHADIKAKHIDEIREEVMREMPRGRPRGDFDRDRRPGDARLVTSVGFVLTFFCS